MDTNPAGRTWVLLSGTLCTGAVFDGMLDVLGVPPERRHPVRLDKPTVEDYGAALDGMAADAVVCGFSLGAIVAAHHADRLPAHRLVLFGVNPHPDDPSRAQGRHDLERDVRVQGGAGALRMRAPAMHGPAPERARDAAFAMAEANMDFIGAQTRLALTRPGALPALAKARMPVLALTGSRDDAAPPALGRAAADAAPDGTFHLLDGLGHYALLEDPRACAAALMHRRRTDHGTA